MADLDDAKTILTTTYRRSGEPVSTPTWMTPLAANTLGFWTSSASGKAKRLRRDSRVVVQPCNQRGVPRPGATAVQGTAQLFTSGPVFDRVQAAIKAKYGVQVPISKFFNWVGHLLRGGAPYGDIVVVVTIQS
ncbi:PPOX class F420-dependent oxidoreductase [Nocardia panacis]|uniref:PPOX class F420-dependent oxidoreductase n=1 Tax=Nocardia panacis TaxID=2340916 RepID=A0A3A4KPT4_9NOCA|nr:PPOX class F420-dependent oxidoreductase [Nocardia panacis]RJO77565.1 PPOX class F420-dependent oxidoreductase [Nocardia panacis]